MNLPDLLVSLGRVAAAVGLVFGARAGLAGETQVPVPRFHLTARPWQPLDVSADRYLDAIEGICRFTAAHQDAAGAVIDPFLHREHQYSTPYFAVGVGVLIRAGRAPDLLDNGIRAMDHATACFAGGDDLIPDRHGEFFLASLPVAVELYRGHVPAATLDRWRDRLRTSRDQVVRGGTNNWRAYAMKGEWLRYKMGLVSRESATAFIEDAWVHAEQRERIADDRWNLYEDRGVDPESHAVEAVGRGNLLALIDAGYDGPSSPEMRALAERGTRASLLLQDPSGQCPPGGRTADHVFNDVLYQLCFEILAKWSLAGGDAYAAGQYRHAAMLSFNSIQRWRRDDGAWAGSYFVTKNHFDPAMRVGYQPASNYGNYNGALMMHLAEAYLDSTDAVAEQPAPVEIGGYAFATDEHFASAVANAGGMQVFVALRGDTTRPFDRYWTALGIARLGRVGWDTRLGPSDGIRDKDTGRGVTFAPTWRENGKWVNLADVPERYRGTFTVQFAHPLLVRCAIDYAPIHGPGPSFRQELLITPDGVLSTVRSDGSAFGVTFPLLANDGSPLHTRVVDRVASTAYRDDGDQQAFIALDAGSTLVTDPSRRVQSAYGWLQSVRSSAVDGVNHTFVYPRSASDPSAQAVASSFRVTADGYESTIGRVHGTLYVGRTSAGGEGQRLDLEGDGKPDLTFDHACRFLVQLNRGKVLAIEADRKTTATLNGTAVPLEPYTPATLAK